MRIISQDGTLDIPYEQVIVQRFKEKIYVLNKNLTGVVKLCDDMQIAKYSTEEKAKEAIRQLKYAYLCHNRVKIEGRYPICDAETQEGMGGVYTFPQDNEVKE